MFHSFFRNLFGIEKYIGTCLKRKLGGKRLQSQGYAGPRIKIWSTCNKWNFQQK